MIGARSSQLLWSSQILVTPIVGKFRAGLQSFLLGVQHVHSLGVGRVGKFVKLWSDSVGIGNDGFASHAFLQSSCCVVSNAVLTWDCFAKGYKLSGSFWFLERKDLKQRKKVQIKTTQNKKKHNCQWTVCWVCVWTPLKEGGDFFYIIVSAAKLFLQHGVNEDAKIKANVLNAWETDSAGHLDLLSGGLWCLPPKRNIHQQRRRRGFNRDHILWSTKKSAGECHVATRKNQRRHRPQNTMGFGTLIDLQFLSLTTWTLLRFPGNGYQWFFYLRLQFLLAANPRDHLWLRLLLIWQRHQQIWPCLQFLLVPGLHWYEVYGHSQWTTNWRRAI